MPVRANRENLRYLRTKRDRMGHELEGLDEYDLDVPDGPPGIRPGRTGYSTEGARMSGVGEPTLDLANAEDIRLAIIASQWHEVICTSLLNRGHCRRNRRRGGRPDGDPGRRCD